MKRRSRNDTKKRKAVEVRRNKRLVAACAIGAFSLLHSAQPGQALAQQPGQALAPIEADEIPREKRSPKATTKQDLELAGGFGFGIGYGSAVLAVPVVLAVGLGRAFGCVEDESFSCDRSNRINPLYLFVPFAGPILAAERPIERSEVSPGVKAVFYTMSAVQALGAVMVLGSLLADPPSSQGSSSNKPNPSGLRGSFAAVRVVPMVGADQVGVVIGGSY
ncbi:MAG: hypothetical protein VB934_01590 [Polyangiaceae bacterium]